MRRLSGFLFAAFGLIAFAAVSAAPLTSPKAHFGFGIGDDYQLATFAQTEAYFSKLSTQSSRVKLLDIGPTEEGRRQCMLVVTSAANHARLERYRDISRKLGRAEGLTDEQARSLAAQGKAVVWIDGGLHANETAGFMQLIETAWQFASRNDAETLRILDNVIILFVHANPDGQELVASWYMRQQDPKKRSLADLPRLYQKYIGHDNNRDFFMLNMDESVNMSRQMYMEWLPQIMYNHHQTAPAGTVIAIPPYRGPFNYVYDPLVISGLDALGAAMYNRFNQEDKPGAVRQDGAVYSTWWNGGLRTTAYFHNIVGVLTEITGSPTPMVVPIAPDRLVPSMALPNPVAPQLWHFRRTIDYSVTANYAVLDYAARHRDEVLYNMYRMGRNAIERGSQDHWTYYPSRVEALRVAREKQARQTTAPPPAGGKPEEKTAEVIAQENDQFLGKEWRKPEWRDARAYIIPSAQADFPTAVKFINALIKSGIRVHRATSDFTANGRSYPAGSYVVKTAQAFRAHVVDMFEPQDHPNDFRYEGGPPIRPYDSAGWTLAYAMGVQFDRVLEALDGPFSAIPYGELQSPPRGQLTPAATVAGWIVSPRQNDAFILVNALLRKDVEVYRLADGVSGQTAFGPGTFFVPSGERAREQLEKDVARLGLTAAAVTERPAGTMLRLSAGRIALLDWYGGSMTSGWTRWLFEQFDLPFEVIYPPQIDAGNLNAKYDVIVFPDGTSLQKTVPADKDAPTPSERGIPADVASRMGQLTVETSLPVLKQFLEQGGRIVAMGADPSLAGHFGLPVSNALTEVGRDGKEQPLSNDKFFIPGSILQLKVDASLPAAWGLTDTVDCYSGQDSAFRLLPEAVGRGVKPIAWFAGDKLLRSGWGWGQHYLQNSVAAFVSPVGAGDFYLYAANANFRGQTHGVFKLLFNPLYRLTD